jgi:anti-anti-sigma factor
MIASGRLRWVVSDRMPEFFNIIADRGCRVIELSMPAGVDASEFDRLNSRALAKIRENAGDGWVLDLVQFQYVGSAALGFIINVRQLIVAGGGVLVLCGVSPSIAAILRTSSLGRLFLVAGTRDAAIEQIETWRNRR